MDCACDCGLVQTAFNQTSCKPHEMGLKESHKMGFAMIDAEEHFAKLNEDAQIWTTPQFTVSDVCTITAITTKALEHFVDPKRDMVRLSGNHANPGKGKRRIFTGEQVLMIKATYVMSVLGFPQRFSRVMTETVARRAISLSIGLSLQTNLNLITYPTKSGDWAVVPIYNESTEEPKLPVAVQLLDVDRLISETLQQLEAIVNGQEIPDFGVPDIPPEPNPFAPASNYFRAWEKDDSGRWKYVGLTWEESEELLALTGFRLNGDELEELERPRLSPEQSERREELRSRHEYARQIGLGASFED